MKQDFEREICEKLEKVEAQFKHEKRQLESEIKEL